MDDAPSVDCRGTVTAGTASSVAEQSDSGVTFSSASGAVPKPTFKMATSISLVENGEKLPVPPDRIESIWRLEGPRIRTGPDFFWFCIGLRSWSTFCLQGL
ncbi:hypothetical protein ACOMHN_047718 [Nucella lapillus]